MSKVESSLLTSIVAAPPLRVVIDLNEACNMRCVYCHIDAPFAPHYSNLREMPIEAFIQVSRDVEEMQVFDLTLTGGEITTMPNFGEYLKQLSRLDFVASQIISNGTTLTERTIDQYVDAGLARLSISLDGFLEQNDLHRGQGAFSRALRGLRVAVAAGLNVNVISVLSYSNYSDWFNISNFMKREGARSNNLSLICRLGRAEEMPVWPGLNDDQVKWLIDDYTERRRLLSSEEYSVILNTGALDPGRWDGTPIAVHQLQDIIPGTEAVIKVNGDVHTNRLVGKTSPIGNIYNTPLSDIWEESKEYRLRIAQRIITDPETSVNNYYYLQPRRTPSRTALKSDAVSATQEKRRVRVLNSGDQIIFSPGDFTAQLRQQVGE
jgi:MoaA/NifB/PqqE/SkfB family radical SAM enzyme